MFATMTLSQQGLAGPTMPTEEQKGLRFQNLAQPLCPDLRGRPGAGAGTCPCTLCFRAVHSWPEKDPGRQGPLVLMQPVQHVEQNPMRQHFCAQNVTHIRQKVEPHDKVLALK